MLTMSSNRFLSGIVALIAGFVLNGQCLAQDATYVVYLQTNFPEALVYSDSLYLGPASLGVFHVPGQDDELRLVPPAVDMWSVPAVRKHIDASPGDTVRVSIDFPYHYQIESVPFTAQVFLEQPGARTLLGTTPLSHQVMEPLRGMLLVQKDGFEPERFSPGEAVWNYHRTVLREEEIIEEAIAEGKYWKPERRAGRWLEIAAGSVALVSGVAAIHFKAKADRRFDRYAISGDPTLRGGFERYDRYAAVSLGAMQVGLGVLAFRLVID